MKTMNLGSALGLEVAVVVVSVVVSAVAALGASVDVFSVVASLAFSSFAFLRSERGDDFFAFLKGGWRDGVGAAAGLVGSVKEMKSCPWARLSVVAKLALTSSGDVNASWEVDFDLVLLLGSYFTLFFFPFLEAFFFASRDFLDFRSERFWRRSAALVLADFSVTCFLGAGSSTAAESSCRFLL